MSVRPDSHKAWRDVGGDSGHAREAAPAERLAPKFPSIDRIVVVRYHTVGSDIHAMCSTDRGTPLVVLDAAAARHRLGVGSPRCC
jgi:hypothetical protein